MINSIMETDAHKPAAPVWMDTLESIEAAALTYKRCLPALLDQNAGHAITMGADGSNVQDRMGRLFFRSSHKCAPGEILRQGYTVWTNDPGTTTHQWMMHFRVIAPVTFAEVKKLASFCADKTMGARLRPGNWYEVHAD